MPLLVNHRGEPLEDSKGQQIKAGSTVVHDFLGEGIATGTVPLEKGDGVNITIDWLGAARGTPMCPRMLAPAT